jgi:nickel transport protein
MDKRRVNTMVNRIICNLKFAIRNLKFEIRNLKFAIPVFFLVAAPAFAHGIRVSAAVEGKSIRGRVTYQDGSPVKHCAVTGHDAADEVLAKTETDEDGKFSLETLWRCDYHLEAETGDGHGGEYVVKASLLPGDLPPRENRLPAESQTGTHDHHHAGGDSSTPGDENAWTVEQIRLMQAKLDVLQGKFEAGEKSIRLRDILGGLGYILGVFGLYAVARNYRKKNGDSS